MFNVANRKVGKGQKPFIIAEISANHGGSIQRAKDTILAAKRSGADAVKIQTFTPDTMTLNSKKPDFLISDGLWKGYNLYELYKEAHTPFEWHSETLCKYFCHNAARYSKRRKNVLFIPLTNL